MGSLLKRGDVWYVTYDLPRKADGIRRQKMKSCPGMTKHQAEQCLRDIEHGIVHGTYIDPTTSTLTDYLERWIDHCEQRGLADSTIVGYRGCIDRYINPDIGHVKMSKLRGYVLQQFLDTLGKPRKQGGRELSQKTVYNVHGVLRKALKQSVKWEMLDRNPMDSVDPPKLRLREMPTASDEELASLLAALMKSPYRIPVLISLSTGMRRGEAIGLKWEDFDAQKAELHIRRSMAQVPGRQPFPKEPKTGQQRTVGLTESMVEELNEHRKGQLREKLARGEDYATDEGWICTQPNGVHIAPNALTKAFIRMRDRVGAKISFHGLRHTVATELLSAGLSINEVSALLGHAKPSVTLNIYGHATPRTRTQTVSLVDEMLKRVQKPKTGSG